MAQTLTDASENPSANAQHNVAEINKSLRECRDQMLDIRSQRRDLNEQAGDIRKRVKDLGVDTRIFEQNVRIHEMESEARAAYMTDFQICYEAMNQGDQMDWVTASGAEQAAE